MQVDDEENVFLHFSTKRMLKTLNDCITSWPKHCNPRDAVVAIDGTFNVTTSKNHTVLMLLAMDAQHNYYVVGVILCSGEKAEHVSRMMVNSIIYTEQLIGIIPEELRNLIYKADLGSAIQKGMQEAAEMTRFNMKRQKC